MAGDSAVQTVSIRLTGRIDKMVTALAEIAAQCGHGLKCLKGVPCLLDIGGNCPSKMASEALRTDDD